MKKQNVLILVNVGVVGKVEPPQPQVSLMCVCVCFLVVVVVCGFLGLFVGCDICLVEFTSWQSNTVGRVMFSDYKIDESRYYYYIL